MTSPDRRGRYFAFQGLFLAVLLLLFLYERPIAEAPWRFSALSGILCASLVFLRFAPDRVLSLWWVQTAFFVGDATLASLTLYWARPGSDLYLIYFLVIFGTALTRSLWQMLAVALVTSALYLASSWHPATGFPDGTEFWLRMHFLWVTTAVLAILSRDSQQAQAEREALYHERMANMESLAALGQVAGEVAHRIKGPLTTILVDAEVLSHELADSPRALKELDQIREETLRCKEILKGLLDLGRIEEMGRVRFDLREQVDSARKSISPQARRAGVTLEVSPMPRSLWTQGDPFLIHESILALLQNAVDASRTGTTIRVEAGVLPGAWFRPGRTDKTIRVTVTDEGNGIPSDKMAHIFRPFYTTKPQGTGLGLSAALRIVQKHGGTIEAHSDGEGKGASFTLTIPAASGRGA